MTALLLCLLVLPALLPALALLTLTMAALGRREPSPTMSGGGRPRVAVLVPAHDESVHLLPTLLSLQAQLSPRDRLLVVADNCSDDTAARARAAGAEVAERCDPQRRGKGYALAFGVDRLRADPPDVVLVVDADCTLSDGAVTAIARACHASAGPVQMLNLMSAPPGAGLKLRVLEFAMLMKNLVRPLGTQRLGGVCHLMGTGMALPWPLMARARLATGHIAEDMQLGVELTRAGQGPALLVEARVSSRFVDDPDIARRQKARWEHGHLDTLRQELPALACDAVRGRSRALAALALDLCIPPVALYFSVLAVLLAFTAMAAVVWPAARPAAALVMAGAAAFGLAVAIGWWRFGRHLLQARELLRLPLYALWKLPVYVGYAVGARSGWVRTQRTVPANETGVQGS
jgi:cellulose synthase/poly-beta-1,6-N-acetylglucosamine synthase-like glycosyltransferase